MKGIYLLFILICFVLSPANAFSYHVLNDISGNSVQFNYWTKLPITFRIDGGTLDGGDGVALFLDACDEWNKIQGVKNICGSWTQIDQDITSSNFNDLTDLSDGVVDIVFDETGQILSSLGLSSTTLGVGITSINSAGIITDGILVLNGSRPSSKTADILATAVHELGHIWGLAHTPIGAIVSTNNTSNFGLDPIQPSAIPTMYPFTNPENDEYGRTLEPDDIAGMKILYPE